MRNQDVFKNLGFQPLSDQTQNETDFAALGFQPLTPTQPSEPIFSLQHLKDILGGIGTGVVSPFHELQQQVEKLGSLVYPQEFKTSPIFEIPERIPVGRPTSPYFKTAEIATEIAPFVPFGVAALKRAPQLAKAIGRGTKKAVTSLTMKQADEHATNFINDLLNGKSLTQAHRPIVEEIREKGNQKQEDFRKKYTNFLNAAIKKGYKPKVKKVRDPILEEKETRTTGVPMIPMGGAFKGAPQLIKAIDEGLKVIDSKTFRKMLSSGYKDYESKVFDPNIFSTTVKNKRIVPFQSKNALNKLSAKYPRIEEEWKKFLKNPSLHQAHKFQSKLGNIGSKFVSSLEGITRHEGGIIYDARKRFLNDITNSLKKYGDKELSTKYTNLSKKYLNEMLPYLENNVTRKIVLKKGIKKINPRNIHNTLKEDSEAINVVKENLSPQSKDLVLAKALNQTKTKGKVNSKKLVKRFDKLDELGFGEFIDERHLNEINKIMEARRRANLTKLGVSGAIGLGLVPPIVRHLP